MRQLIGPSVAAIGALRSLCGAYADVPAQRRTHNAPNLFDRRGMSAAARQPTEPRSRPCRSTVERSESFDWESGSVRSALDLPHHVYLHHHVPRNASIWPKMTPSLDSSLTHQG